MSWIQVPNLKQILVVHFLSFMTAHFLKKGFNITLSQESSLNYDQRSIGQVKLSNKDLFNILWFNPFRQSPNVLSKFILNQEK